MKTAFGMVEVTGLALAITVADVMAKSANITIEGLERANGFGWILIKVTGDVGSVNAAIDTGAAFAKSQQGLCGSKVIARPADGLGRFVATPPVEKPKTNQQGEALANKQAVASQQPSNDSQPKRARSTKTPPAKVNNTKRDAAPSASRAKSVVKPKSHGSRNTTPPQAVSQEETEA
ncbi:BMC domain-containing protein [Photobacterium sp. DNB22_13_2]